MKGQTGIGHMTGRIAIFLAAALAAFTQTATADDRGISSVRQAAIERMQARLGSIRGSIAPADINVRLTPRMIEMRRPQPVSGDRARRPRTAKDDQRSNG